MSEIVSEANEVNEVLDSNEANEVFETNDANIDGDQFQATDTEAEAIESPLDNALVERAKGYGMDDLEGFDAPRLEKMFASIDRRLMQPQQQQMQYQQPQQVQPQAVMPTEYTPLKLEFGEDIDESLVAPLQGVVEQLNNQLGDVHKFRQQVNQEFQTLNLLREFNQFDSFINALGDEWHSDYGQGATLEMDPKSPEFLKRLDVFTGSQNMSRTAAQRGQSLNRGESWKRSHHAVNWDKIAEKANAKVTGKVESRQRSFGERPTKGKSPAMSPRDEAMAEWAKR